VDSTLKERARLPDGPTAAPKQPGRRGDGGWTLPGVDETATSWCGSGSESPGAVLFQKQLKVAYSKEPGYKRDFTYNQ